MYVSKKSGLKVYETFEELLNADIVLMSEYDGYYYIRLKPQEKYDNGMYKVNIKTHEVSFLLYTQYIVNIEDKATPIDPKTLRRAS